MVAIALAFIVIQIASFSHKRKLKKKALELKEGMRVMHATRGEGSICDAAAKKGEGKPYGVQYDNGERHAYSTKSAAKLTHLQGSHLLQRKQDATRKQASDQVQSVAIHTHTHAYMHSQAEEQLAKTTANLHADIHTVLEMLQMHAKRAQIPEARDTSSMLARYTSSTPSTPPSGVTGIWVSVCARAAYAC